MTPSPRVCHLALRSPGLLLFATAVLHAGANAEEFRSFAYGCRFYLKDTIYSELIIENVPFVEGIGLDFPEFSKAELETPFGGPYIVNARSERGGSEKEFVRFTITVVRNEYEVVIVDYKDEFSDEHLNARYSDGIVDDLPGQCVDGENKKDLIETFKLFEDVMNLDEWQ